MRPRSRSILSLLVAVSAVACTFSVRNADPDASATATACDAWVWRALSPIEPRSRIDSTTCPANMLWCTGPDEVLGCGQDRLSNPRRCGECFARCFDSPESVALCREGHCERRCRDPRADCDCNPTTACDTDIWADARNCGGCGNACAEGESCAAGRCVAPSVRLKAPISTLSLRTAKPWFRWALPPDADGARIEVCATRSCEAVEHLWDVTGESFRAPISLSPGVHFWRATARYGETLNATPSPPWEFAVEPTGAREALTDVDGDGVEDDVRALFHGSASWEDYPLGFRSGFEYAAFGPIAIGDVNGDGYGDVGFFEGSLPLGTRGAPWGVDLYVFRGGPSGAATFPRRVRVGYFYQYLSPSGATGVHVSDRDGDGYGDLLVGLTGNGMWSRNQISGPTLTVFEDLDLANSLDPLQGDFNADGAEDLVSWSWPETCRAFGVHDGGARSPPRDVLVETCGAFASSGATHTPWIRVTDHDDDGYDDVVVSCSTTPLVDFVYRGGPTGIDSSRCVAAPP